MERVTAYIALGANVGDRVGNLRAAVERLGETAGMRVVRVSSLVETAAVGGPVGSPPFLNAAAEVETSLSAQALLARLLEVERELGRERRERWGPRTIDLDLLLYGDRVIREEGLVVPHPLMHERPFVLRPLAEVGADARHPVLGMTVGEMLRRME